MSRRRGPVVVAFAVLTALCSVAPGALARDRSGGAAGRLDGDLTLVSGLGASWLAEPSQGLSRLDLRVRYLQTAGIALAYEEGELWQRARRPGAWRRAWSAGVELRPLFPGLFLKNLETGIDWLDLTIASFGVDVGVSWTERVGVSSKDTAGLGLYAGAALEFPLMSAATGLWLRLSGQGRWTGSALAGEDSPGRTAAVFGFGIAWHHLVDARLATGRDRGLE